MKKKLLSEVVKYATVMKKLPPHGLAPNQKKVLIKVVTYALVMKNPLMVSPRVPKDCTQAVVQ